MAVDARRRLQAPLHLLDVGAADATGGDAYEDFPFFEGGHGHVLDADVVGAAVDGRLLAGGKRHGPRSYFLFTVRLHDASYARSRANPKKIYCIDHAFVTSVASGVLVAAGHLLENLIFVALRRVHADVYYDRTKRGREVDFVVPRRKRPLLLVQVCETLASPRTREREIKALGEAMTEMDVAAGIVVTRNEEDRIEIDAGVIQVMPAWRFLLDVPGA